MKREDTARGNEQGRKKIHKGTRAVRWVIMLYVCYCVMYVYYFR